MRCWILLFMGALAICAPAGAGPVDFGVGEVNAALGSRNLRWKIKYELNLEAPETYRIEPYGYGGGHVTGGDLRGLMYGLLEAADQIRSTGRLALTHAVPAIPSRAVRMFLPNGDLSRQPESFWRAYFQTLARSRLNRFTLVFLSANPYPLLVEVNGTPVEGAAGQRERNLRMLRFISQTAAEYAVDFTLAFWDIANPAEMGQYAHDALLILLAECPAIRSVELRPRSADSVALRETVFKALHEVGRRVALQPRGALLDPALEKAAEEAGVALNVPSKSWPPGFEIDPPPGDGHEIFYWMWGRLGYDPKTKPPYGIVEPEEYRIAAQIVNQLRNALLADPDTYLWPQIHASIAAETAAGSSDFVATIPEAIRNRIGDVASAKQTPLDIADSLSSASVGLEKSSTPDFQLLAELARDHSRRLRAAYWIEMFDQLRNPAALARAQQEMTAGESSSEDLSAIENAIEQRRQATDLDPSKEIPEPLKIPPRPQIAHTPVKIVAADQPITLMLQTNPAKDVRLIRLHYRKLDARDWKTIEKPQAPWTFSIPASDLAPDTQFVYYFEILNRENTGWFEPDPLNAIPYHFVRVEPK